ncbi:hypothetical protein J1N35_022113 [Gossypium stocksii]|uniref:Uncharacterized protein n=1 Tax=Gossypium stocksii TaxID=47602 RepID=A0A9D3VH00_9ROSI|nr:hypothetical protein J1N35_022113 [Gossypium stocksii]
MVTGETRRHSSIKESKSTCLKRKQLGHRREKCIIVLYKRGFLLDAGFGKIGHCIHGNQTWITVELGLDFSSRMDLESVDTVSQPPVKASDIETPAEADGVKVPASTDGIKHNDKANEVEPPVRTNDIKSPIETYDVEPPKAGDNAPTDISSWGRKFKFPTLIPPP